MILSQTTIQGCTTEVTICPLGDLQWAGDRRDIAFDHLQEHIERCLSLPNPLFLGMGDYIDFMSPSNRDAWRGARIYDTSRRVVDDKARELTADVYETILKPTKGKWLGMLSGHHYFPLQSGGNTDMLLCSMLDAPYLGVCTVINLAFVEKTHTQSIKIYAHHGCGDSVFPHGPVQKLYRVAPHWNVDVFVMGHQTKLAKARYDRVDPIFPSKGEARLGHRNVLLVGAGGWSKGYVEEDRYGTYVEKGMMNPVALGQPVIHVRPKWRTTTRHGIQVWEPNITEES